MNDATARQQLIDKVVATTVHMDPADRSPYIESICAGDRDLLAEIAAALTAAAAYVAQRQAVPKESRGLGPYQLIEKIGEGGMAEVWLAVQTAPVNRKVAIKLIKTGMETRGRIARFESERQTLAMMQHPGIAQVFDGGTTPEGFPYVVMEYVAGISITEYCNKHTLTLSQRLELFVQVCGAVQHAHQKAIIHRDLKPSNILVAEQDGKPVPKVIDFGLAKEVAPELAQESMLTEVGVVVGTPEYMSPEQATLNCRDIDTRTDVYSLGLILYELISGSLPFDRKELRRLTFDEMLRRIREEEAPRPSARALMVASNFSDQKKRELQNASRYLRGDLDWIALKALEKDRERRYSTPAELAADVTRHLEHQAVMARPATIVYRARKYAQRHTVGVAVSAAIVTLLAALAVTQTIQVRRITRERDRSERITAFVMDMLKGYDPLELGSQAPGTTVREILDKGSNDVRNRFGGDPEVEARLLATIGKVYLHMRAPENAERSLRQSVILFSRFLGPKSRPALSAKTTLSEVLVERNRYDEAVKVASETLELQRRVFGSDDPGAAKSETVLGMAYQRMGKLGEAEKLLRESLAIERTIGPNRPDTWRAAMGLASNLSLQNRHGEAEAIEREYIEIASRNLGPEHPYTLYAVGMFATDIASQGQLDEAARLLSHVVQSHRQSWGEDEGDTVGETHALINILVQQKNYARALELERSLVVAEHRVRGADDPATLGETAALVAILCLMRNFSEAEPLAQENVNRRQRVLGPENPDTLISMNDLAVVLVGEHRLAEGERLQRQVLDVETKVLGPVHPSTALSIYNIACIKALRHQSNQSLQWLRASIEHGLAPDVALAIDKDSDLRSLRRDSRFKQLVVYAKQKANNRAR